MSTRDLRVMSFSHNLTSCGKFWQKNTTIEREKMNSLFLTLVAFVPFEASSLELEETTSDETESIGIAGGGDELRS